MKANSARRTTTPDDEEQLPLPDPELLEGANHVIAVGDEYELLNAIHRGKFLPSSPAEVAGAIKMLCTAQDWSIEEMGLVQEQIASMNELLAKLVAAVVAPKSLSADDMHELLRLRALADLYKEGQGRRNEASHLRLLIWREKRLADLWAADKPDEYRKALELAVEHD